MSALFPDIQSKEAGVDTLARIMASAGFQAEVQDNTFINGNNEWVTFQSSVSLLHIEHDLAFKLKEKISEAIKSVFFFVLLLLLLLFCFVLI